MSIREALLAIALSVFVAGCGQQAAEEDAAKADTATQAPARTVTLDADDIEDLGLTTSAIARTQYTPAVGGYGVVTSLDALAQMDSDLTNAEAALRLSQAQLARQRSLAATMGALSKNELETSERQAAADAAQLALAQRKGAASFGLNAPWRAASNRAAWLARLASGRERLVHATFPLGQLPAKSPASLTIAHLDRRQGAASWKASQVWEAPADPTVPGRSFFALVEGGDLAEGERVLAEAPVGEPQPGVLVPADAIVLSEGQAWCYIVTKPGTFVRKSVDLSKPMPGGYFVAAGIEAGQSVVTAGTGLLLARETNPETEIQD